MRIIVFMNVPHWGEGLGCQDSSCSLLSLPRRPVSACSVRRRWQERVFPWQKCNLFYTHTHTHKIVHNVLFPQALEMSIMLFPCSDIQACLPESAMPESQPPAPCSTGQAGGWAPTAATRQCSGLL